MNHRDNLHLRIEALEERQMLSTVDLTATAASDFTTRIEENAQGFFSVDGSVDNNNTGFTGSGFANTANVAGNGVNWSVNSATGGRYELKWRYALPSGERPGKILINGQDVGTQNFAPTGSWTSWAETSGTVVNLAAGTSTIRLEGTNASALPNIDFLELKALDQPTSSNLAAGKPTSQSSTSYGGAASRAVDGNTNRSYGGGSVTHTGNEANAWWQVDLGENFDISQIEITNRGDNLEGRLASFDVFVSATDMTGKSYSQLAGDSSISRTRFSGSAGAVETFSNPGTGRYVRVQLAGSGVLSLAEVKVFGDVASSGDNNDERTIQGTDGNDTIQGGAGPELIQSLGGNDTVRGGGGNDRLDGGDGDDLLQGETGDDRLRGGKGNDRIDGGDGTDTAVFNSISSITSQSDGAILVSSADGNDRLRRVEVIENSDGLKYSVEYGAYSADELYIKGTDTAETISGGNGKELIQGLGGNDTLRGGGGDDRLDGGDGDDLLQGEAGNDRLRGGGGDDRIDGGDGTDTASFNGITRISANSDGSYNVTSADGSDRIRNIEFIENGSTRYSLADALNEFQSTTLNFSDFYAANGQDFKPAMQAAINQLAETGGTIILDNYGTGRFNGIYNNRSGEGLTRSSGTALITITTADAKGNKAEIRHAADGSLLSFSGANNFRIQNIKVVGQEGRSGENVTISGSQNMVLRRVDSINSQGAGIQIVGSSDVVVLDSLSQNAGVHGVRISKSINVTLSGLTVINPRIYGIGIQKRGENNPNVRILNSRVINPATMVSTSRATCWRTFTVRFHCCTSTACTLNTPTDAEKLRLSIPGCFLTFEMLRSKSPRLMAQRR